MAMRLLSEFMAGLSDDNSPYRFGHDHAHLVKNLILSKAPITGIAEGEFERQSIEHWLTPDADINPLLNVVSIVISRDPPGMIPGPLFPVSGAPWTRRRRFEHVMIDEEKALKRLAEDIGNAAPPLRFPPGRPSRQDEVDALCGDGPLLSAGDIATALGMSKKQASRYRKNLRDRRHVKAARHGEPAPAS
jgi:hypothetical protein